MPWRINWEMLLFLGFRTSTIILQKSRLVHIYNSCMESRQEHTKILPALWLSKKMPWRSDFSGFLCFDRTWYLKLSAQKFVYLKKNSLFCVPITTLAWLNQNEMAKQINSEESGLRSAVRMKSFLQWVWCGKRENTVGMTKLNICVLTIRFHLA